MSCRIPHPRPLHSALLAALSLALAAAPASAWTSRNALHLKREPGLGPMSVAPGSSAFQTAPSRPPSCSGTCSITMNYMGGRMLSNVKVYAIYWSSNVPGELQSALGPFYAAIVNSPYMDWLNQYNTNINATAGASVGAPGTNQFIGRGVLGGTFVINPINTSKSLADGTANDFANELDAQIAAGHLPPADANSIYMLHFPPGYVLDDGQGSKSCQVFCAFHGGWNPATDPSLNAVYAIIPNQNSDGCQNGCGPLATTAQGRIDNTSVTSAHELIEAVTDPEVFALTGSVLNKPLGWYDTEGNSQGEVGDMCNGFQGTIAGLDNKSYVVQQNYARLQQGTNTRANYCTESQTAAIDYAIYMDPNTATVATGSSVQVPILARTTAGSASSLTLSVDPASLPAGVTASFGSPSVNTNSSGVAVTTMTLTASGSAAKVRDAVVVVKASNSGSPSNIHTAAVLLQVTGGGTSPGTPTVSITSPVNGASVAAGTIPVTATAAASSGTTISSFTLSIDGTQVTSVSSGTISYSWTAPVGSHTLVAKVTDTGSGTSTATSSVTVTTAQTTGFSLSVSNGTTIVFPGKLASINVSTSNTGTGAAPTISGFAVTGLPSGVTATFAPSSVTAGTTTTLTLSASAGATAGGAASALTISGTAAGVTHNATGAAAVKVDGLPVITSYSPTGGNVSGNAVPISMTASAGAGTTLSTLVVKVDGSIQVCTPVTGSGSLGCSWNSGAVSAGSHTLNFTALDFDGGTTTQNATINVTVPPANEFSIALSPTSRTVTPGGAAATYTVTTAVTSGAAETITFSQTGLPAGIGALFNPSTVTAGQSTTLSVAAPAGTAAVPATTFTVLGKTVSVPSGHGATGTLTVAAGPVVTITSPAAGATLSGTATLTASATVDGTTTLSKIEFFDGSNSLGSGTASPASVSWNTTGAADGSHTLTVKATDAAGNVGSASVPVTVANFTSSDFGITVTPGTQSVGQGSAVNYTVNVTKTGGPLDVTLAVSGLGAGLTGALLSDLVTSGSTTTLQLMAASNAPLATTTFTITGSAVGGSHAGTGQVTVTLPGAGTGGMTVALSAPLDGSSVSGVVTMKATATVGAGHTLKRIDFLVDGAVIGSATTSPGTVKWDTSGLASNTYAVSAKAYDEAGNKAVSEVAVVTIPALSAPAAGCGSLGAPGFLALAGLLALRRRRQAA